MSSSYQCLDGLLLQLSMLERDMNRRLGLGNRVRPVTDAWSLEKHAGIAHGH
jgi:hypothetical protein